MLQGQYLGIQDHPFGIDLDSSHTFSKLQLVDLVPLFASITSTLLFAAATCLLLLLNLLLLLLIVIVITLRGSNNLICLSF